MGAKGKNVTPSALVGHAVWEVIKHRLKGIDGHLPDKYEISAFGFFKCPHVRKCPYRCTIGFHRWVRRRSLLPRHKTAECFQRTPGWCHRGFQSTIWFPVPDRHERIAFVLENGLTRVDTHRQICDLNGHGGQLESILVLPGSIHPERSQIGVRL